MVCILVCCQVQEVFNLEVAPGQVFQGNLMAGILDGVPEITGWLGVQPQAKPPK